MTVISKASSDHPRSGSSDSFVCVSEDTLNEARDRQQAITEFDPLDPDGWGLVMPATGGGGGAREGGGEEEEEEEGGEADKKKKQEEEEEDKAVGSDVDAGSSNSDWESWDD